MAKRIINVDVSNVIPFHNNVDFCVGTGRMGLALQQEYQEQLKLVQEEIGFKHIRGHGLFCDDMAIYQEYEKDGEIKVEYNYTYLDMVMDSYKRVGLKPFLELGFMPQKLASGTQTVFYWKGNTTPPKDYDKWCHMVKALLEYLITRYGKEEVLTWPIEVWNEPNLPGFWEKADMQEYFKLFKRTFLAVKVVDEEVCNPLKLWHDMGEPTSLDEAQKKLLRLGAIPAVYSKRVEPEGIEDANAEENNCGTAMGACIEKEKSVKLEFNVKRNGVVYFSLTRNKIVSDRGYDYNRAKESDM